MIIFLFLTMVIVVIKWPPPSGNFPNKECTKNENFQVGFFFPPFFGFWKLLDKTILKE